MDPAPDARQAALVRRVDVFRPFECDVDARPFLENEELVLRHRELALAARKVRIARKQRQELGRRAREGRMPGDVTGEWRRHESRALVGPPVFRQDPADTCSIEYRIADVRGTSPGIE